MCDTFNTGDAETFSTAAKVEKKYSKGFAGRIYSFCSSSGERETTS